MPRRRALFSAVLVLTLIALTVALYPRLRAAAGPQPQIESRVATVCPATPQHAPGIADPTIALGAPAITPRNTCTPSFTAQDVLAYVYGPNVKNYGLVDSVVGRPTVTRILFTTDGDLAAMLHGADPGLASNAIVCYIEFAGDFISTYGPYGAKPAHTHTAGIVFDAHNGNSIMYRG
jgi:hypothetical protein